MKNLTEKELQEINGGSFIDPTWLIDAIEFIVEQLDAIEAIPYLTGTSDDYH